VRRIAFSVMAGVCAPTSFNAAQPARAKSKDEQDIRALEDKLTAAFNVKNTHAIMTLYVPGNELFVFDLGVPRQHVGWNDYKNDWQDFFAMFHGLLKFYISDPNITSDGKIAYGHSIQHMAGMEADGSRLNSRSD